jgi:DNA-binding transcriptional LysR family regulator
VTQSTVTVRIAALEAQLGQQLFVREKSGIELTVAGRKFMPYAELLLQTWQHARQDLALSSSQTAMFSIGVCATLWESIVGPWLLEIQRNLPNLALNVDVRTSATVLELLAQGFLDAAVLYEPSPRKDVVIEELFADPLVLVSTYPRKAERWNPHYVYIRWGDDFEAQHRAIMPSDITPPVTVSDGRIGLEFILARGGSGYLPWRQVRDMVEAGKLFRVENSCPMMRHAYVAYTEAVRAQLWFPEALAMLRDLAAAEMAQTEELSRSARRRHEGAEPAEASPAELPAETT